MNASLFRKPDFWFGAVGIALSAFLYVQTQHLTEGAVNDKVGAAFFPRLLIGCIFVLCVYLIFRARGSNPHKASEDLHTLSDEAATTEHGGIRLPLATAAVAAACILAVPYIGFYPGAALLIAGVMWMAGARKLWLFAVVIAAILGFEYVVFDKLLGVLFPTSSLMEF
jgi:Tripartite tricarboxylate transporter TctB family